jgi:hypothetical protein
LGLENTPAQLAEKAILHAKFIGKLAASRVERTSLQHRKYHCQLHHSNHTQEMIGVGMSGSIPIPNFVNQ